MALIKIEGKANIQGKTIFGAGPAGYNPTDANAISYFAAVQAADGSLLEDPVKQAIENFIVGCKSDGIWNSLKASCILAGAKTLNGALVPLVGTAPTNFNFVSADYNRKTGLKGNGTTKYLNSNRNNNADPANNRHAAVWRSAAATNNGGLLGSGAITAGHSYLYTGYGAFYTMLTNTSSADSSQSLTASPSVTFYGASRNNASNYTVRHGGVNYLATIASRTPVNSNLLLFSSYGLSNARLSFYSIGESVDLTKLDTRVSALMTALNTAI